MHYSSHGCFYLTHSVLRWEGFVEKVGFVPLIHTANQTVHKSEY